MLITIRGISSFPAIVTLSLDYLLSKPAFLRIVSGFLFFFNFLSLIFIFIIEFFTFVLKFSLKTNINRIADLKNLKFFRSQQHNDGFFKLSLTRTMVKTKHLTLQKAPMAHRQ